MEQWGEVFGFAFAIEGLFFFLEAIFIAIYVYGWDRLSPRAHLLSGLPIVISGIGGSSAVIAVNGWMNNPQGFDLAANGDVTNVRPFEALFNANLWHEEVHMYLAGLIVASALVAAVYAVAWLRGRRDRYHRAGLIVPLAVLALSAPAQLIVGDWAARTVAEEQPTKLAAFEGLEETTKGAGLTLGGVYVRRRGPRRHHDPEDALAARLPQPQRDRRGPQRGPRDDRPPVGVVRNSFQVMVGIGTLLAGLGALVPVVPVAAGLAAGHPMVLPPGRRRRPARAHRPDRRLDRHRGRPPALDRLRLDANRGVRDRRRGRSRSATPPWLSSTSASEP